MYAREYCINICAYLTYVGMCMYMKWNVAILHLHSIFFNILRRRFPRMKTYTSLVPYSFFARCTYTREVYVYSYTPISTGRTFKIKSQAPFIKLYQKLVYVNRTERCTPLPRNIELKIMQNGKNMNASFRLRKVLEFFYRLWINIMYKKKFFYLEVL